MFDGLHALPGTWNELDDAARRRLRLLIWEAGARGLSLSLLGRWLWSTPGTIEALIAEPARGHLGERVVAARAIAVFAEGFVEDVSPARARMVIDATRALVDHPEPAVWTAAARGLGRLTGGSASARMLVFRAATADRLHTRRRNLVSIASMPLSVGAESWIEDQIAEVLDDKALQDDPWKAAALAIATPHLARERPELWERLCSVVLEADSLELAWSLSQGLAILSRHCAGGGWAAGEERIARALHARLIAAQPTASNEIARHLDTLNCLDRALGREPSIELPFDTFDARIHADIEVRPAPMPVLPRAVFDRDVDRLETGDEIARGRALLGLRSATRTHAMRLPELVLGHESGDRDTRHMLQICRDRLAARTGDYGTRAALVGAITDLVGGAGTLHGRSAADALRAIAQSQWVADIGRDAIDPAKARAVRRDIQRFRKPFEDLFHTCLSSQATQHEELTVPPPVAAWWALCAGPAAVLGPIERTPKDSSALDPILASFEQTLRDAVHAPTTAWGPAARDSLHALRADTTVLGEAVGRLLEILVEIETSPPSDQPEATRRLTSLASISRTLVAIGHDLDEALAPANDRVPSHARSAEPRWIAGSVTLQSSDGVSSTPWEDLSPPLRAIVEPRVRVLLSRLSARDSFVATRGAKLGHFELVDQIARGGMGEVWRAVWHGVRPVALKLPRLDVPAYFRSELAEVLRAEASMMAKIDFARVAVMLDSGVIDGTPYLATGYIRGRTLEKHLISDPAAVPHRDHLSLVRRIVRDMCIGLDNLHRHGLVHRDLKPGNVMLRMRGRQEEQLHSIVEDPLGDEIDEAVLIDFGIAHEFNLGGARGATPGYAAPEVAAETSVGPTADIYALGATLFHVMTRRLLTGARGANAAMEWHRDTDPFEDRDVIAAATSLPASVRDAIAGACRRDPAARISLTKFRNLVCDTGQA
ncbi:MAG: serine/threonine protein kinase [Deltaproteobacteria bacterium]|nr:serine/threonine protein kinase [Deltaproteobacteria bacterium]